MKDQAVLIGVSFDDRILMAMNEIVSLHRDGSVITLTWRSSRKVKRQIETAAGTTEEIDDVESFEENEEHVFGRDDAERRRKFIQHYAPIFYGGCVVARETSQG